MLRLTAILPTLLAWIRVRLGRGFSAAMLAVLVSAFAASGLSFAWCESMQTVSCCCCDGEPSLDEVFAELSDERFAPKLEAAPCCGSREVPSVPDAGPSTPNDAPPQLAAGAVLPSVVTEPAPRFSAHVPPPPSSLRPCDPARAGPPSALARCTSLKRFHC